ncbi:hypothetical protein HV454_14325 [Bacillus sporothermodurans]|uniref:hypothetical protein n=1 Tax=Heyndrickxia sporothermodurans TaxID=46224 RepID=UPI00192B7DFD|nr:hypothetical protein [Heyndrickxia sporothermodurans]MBL5768795.1 hypothetical protein [Heyndrickxia sporothermodurans]MBL5786686.1 hypothetical protein [Heyndrickxia sporothermodurans]MBL5878132.1 hypothetical protein [Heyndrickxia sporothermodurans]MBL5909817.1 hypothetical protein [Heyndrickxia sporothermodurans]
MLVNVQSGDYVDVCFQALEKSDVKKYGLTKRAVQYLHVHDKKVCILARQSFTISSGACPFTRRLRTCQSKLFTWSVKITP